MKIDPQYLGFEIDPLPGLRRELAELRADYSRLLARHNALARMLNAMECERNAARAELREWVARNGR